MAALQALARDVRAIFDGAGLTKDLASRANLIAYSPDWSQWMGVQHAGITGIFPHLDSLFAMEEIDVVSFDNYLPLSDWTTGAGGLDAVNWRSPPTDAWPNADPSSLGFGLATAPSRYDVEYLKANIENGEKCDYWYDDYASALSEDPDRTDVAIIAPQTDRLSQNRRRFYPGQELFAFKKLRWWWANLHYAVYDAGDGQGAAPHGAPTAWTPKTKPIAFMEYGFASIDKCTNEENVFFDPASVSGGAPFWCAWEDIEGGGDRPVRDDTLQYLAHRAWWEYWNVGGNNETSDDGVEMIASDLMFAWTWDARPFPTFPLRTDIWSDSANWRCGHWLQGKGPARVPGAPDQSPTLGAYPTFPSFRGLAWSVRYSPQFQTAAAAHVSGRETRCARMSGARWRIEMSFDALDPHIEGDYRRLAAFYAQLQGQDKGFWVAVPDRVSSSPLLCRFEDDQADLEEFMAQFFCLQSLKLVSLKS